METLKYGLDAGLRLAQRHVKVMPDCEQCLYHRVWRSTTAPTGYEHSCQHPRSVMHRVVGGVVTCERARSETYPCGPDGKLWEAQPA